MRSLPRVRGDDPGDWIDVVVNRLRKTVPWWARLPVLLQDREASAGIRARAPWVVRLLFEREAFTAENTFAVSEVLRIRLLQLPFYFAGAR